MNTSEYTQGYYAQAMPNHAVLDIETIPNPEMIKLLPEATIDARLKDPEKIKEAQLTARQTQLDKMALSPLTGKVACVGWYNHKMDIASCIMPDVATSEKVLLDETYDMIRNHIIITYNGKNFDLPFIFKRGIMLGCTWATIPEMKRFTDRYKSSDMHIDVMAEFCNYGEFEKLDNLARYMLGDKKVEFDVTKIAGLLKTEEGRNKVANYCRSDCRITWELAKRMGFVKDLPKPKLEIAIAEGLVA